MYSSSKLGLFRCVAWVGQHLGAHAAARLPACLLEEHSSCLFIYSCLCKPAVYYPSIYHTTCMAGGRAGGREVVSFVVYVPQDRVCPAQRLAEQ